MNIREAKKILKNKGCRLVKETWGVDVRQATQKVYDMIDNGELSEKDVMDACLEYMSEDDVADMARSNDWFSDDDEDEEDED